MKASGRAGHAARAVRGKVAHVELFNSGLEVWLYDDSNLGRIRSGGAWRNLVDGGKTDGLLVGYGLRQDDSLDIDVFVGDPPSESELAAARWLPPQRAFLRLPTGALAIEANDSCRASEEADDWTEVGARVSVPPGNYGVTLYRIDHEALARDAVPWEGARELIVLTRGGSPRDDAGGVLPYRPLADGDWVGRIEIEGATGRGLVWFDDHRDTFMVNIDAAAASRLGLAPGRYLRVTVPAAGLTLLTVFAPSWQDGARLPPPAGPLPDEFGFGSLARPQRWGDAEVLLCRRTRTTTAVADRQMTTWLEATFEAFDAEPATRTRRPVVDALFSGATRAYFPARLADQIYFDDDPHTLAIKLDARVPGVSFEDELELPAAVARLDEVFAELGLTPLGDFCCDLAAGVEPHELTVRAWTGPDRWFAAAWASRDSFEVCYLSRLHDGRWLLTGTIEADDADRITAARARLTMQAADDTSLADLLELHRQAVSGASAIELPRALPGVIELFDDYLAAALG